LIAAEVESRPGPIWKTSSSLRPYRPMCFSAMKQREVPM
jgi:hypothetical protein